jgi:hypothetical protein
MPFAYLLRSAICEARIGPGPAIFSRSSSIPTSLTIRRLDR